jgi:hypothetical protein
VHRDNVGVFIAFFICATSTVKRFFTFSTTAARGITPSTPLRQSATERLIQTGPHAILSAGNQPAGVDAANHLLRALMASSVLPACAGAETRCEEYLAAARRPIF